MVSEDNEICIRMTHPKDGDDQHNSQECNDRLLEPPLAILERQSNLRHITHELGLAGELLAYVGAGRGAECPIRSREGKEGTERKVRDGIVAIETNERRFVLRR